MTNVDSKISKYLLSIRDIELLHLHGHINHEELKIKCKEVYETLLQEILSEITDRVVALAINELKEKNPELFEKRAERFELEDDTGAMIGNKYKGLGKKR